MALYIVKPWYQTQAAPAPIYGAEWAGTSSPAWTRTDDAASFADPNPYYAGMLGTPSSPFDNIMPWSGMRRVTDANAGELVEIPKFYYKLSQNNGVGLKIQISMDQFDGSHVDPMHMDRGDGVGERDYAYVGRYHCSSSNYKSASGVKPKASVTRARARTNIHNLGSNVWQCDFATRFTIWLLYLVEFANFDSQTLIGYGCGNNSSTENVGYTDNMPYHTGTMLRSKTTYGVGTQYRCIEGLWDNVRDWLEGVYTNSSGTHFIINPNNFSDTTGGVNIGVVTQIQQPGSFELRNVSGTYPVFVPATESPVLGFTSYDTDAFWWTSAYPLCIGGGNYGQLLMNGILCIYAAGINDTDSTLGARLMVLPPSRLT